MKNSERKMFTITLLDLETMAIAKTPHPTLLCHFSKEVLVTEFTLAVLESSILLDSWVLEII